MFDADQFGRLSYRPFKHYQLPSLVRVEDASGKVAKAEFRQGSQEDGFGGPIMIRPLYRLRWPGEVSQEVNTLPFRAVRRLPWMKGYVSNPEFWEAQPTAEVPLKQVLDRYSTIKKVVGQEDGRDRWPEEVVYHLAVNRVFDSEGFISSPHVAGLPGPRVDQVLKTRFAVDQSAFSTLAYLKWVAESHYHHPFFQGFDTNVRETLYGLQHEAVRLYFYLLADYRYDFKTRWWDRGLSRFVWQRLATYLHWVGRTGRALYAELSHIIPAEGIRSDVVGDQMQDVVETHKQWVRGVDYIADDGISLDGPKEVSASKD